MPEQGETSTFAGKVALVTGAGSGIGRASAEAFADRGARVVVVDIAAGGGKETVARIEGAGGEARFVECDVSDPAAVRDMVRETIDADGRLDFAHNNAGIIGGGGSIADLDEDVWAKIVAVNLSSVFYCMKYELRAMLERESGAIVNTSSRAGLRGVGGIPGYVATKHGIIGLTRNAAIDYSPRGIRVNAICPGTVRTAMSGVTSDDEPDSQPGIVAGRPIARMAHPREIANAVVWLCSDEAAFVTGTALEVDGGANAL